MLCISVPVFLGCDPEQGLTGFQFWLVLVTHSWGKSSWLGIDQKPKKAHSKEPDERCEEKPIQKLSRVWVVQGLVTVETGNFPPFPWSFPPAYIDTCLASIIIWTSIGKSIIIRFSNSARFQRFEAMCCRRYKEAVMASHLHQLRQHCILIHLNITTKTSPPKMMKMWRHIKKR